MTAGKDQAMLKLMQTAEESMKTVEKTGSGGGLEQWQRDLKKWHDDLQRWHNDLHKWHYGKPL